MDHFFDGFSTLFVKIDKITHFGHFRHFLDLSGPRVVKTSWTPKVPHCRKWEKPVVFSVQNVVSKGWSETPKSGHCSKGLSKPRAGEKKCKTVGQKKSRKSALFRKSIKTVKMSLFCTFLTPSSFVISDRVLVGFFDILTKMR